MAHIEAHTGWGIRTHALPGFGGLGALLARVAHYREARRRRAAFRMLSSLEPWQLEDIGLSVEDVDWATVLPIETDALAAAKARARRRTVRAGAVPAAPVVGLTDTPVTHAHIAVPGIEKAVVRGRLERPWVMGT